jgi:hypothetical protein
MSDPYDAASKDFFSVTLMRYKAHNPSVTSAAKNTAKKIKRVM